MGIIFYTLMLEGKTPFSKDMLNIVFSGLIIVVFCYDIHAYVIAICRSFCFTCSNNANDFFFID